MLLSLFSSFENPTNTLNESSHFGKEDEKCSFHPLAASSQGNEIGYLPQLVAYHNE